MGSELFHKRLNREKQWARYKAFFVNCFLIHYFIYLCVSISFKIFDLENSIIPYLLWTIPLTVVASLLYTRTGRSLAERLIYRTNKMLKQNIKDDERHSFRWTSFSTIFGGAILVLTFWNGWIVTQMSLTKLFSKEGLHGAANLSVALLTPDFSILPQVIEAMVETIFMALMATTFAIVVAFFGGFLCARNLMKGSFTSFAVYSVLRFVANFTRSVEPLIWAIIFSVWVEIGPFPGMLALMVHSIASLMKQYSEQIEDADNGPIEAIEAVGANKVQTIWYAVLPQVFLPLLAITIFRWDINIRMATIIGLVGGGGIGRLLIQYQGLARWHEVGTIIIVIAIIVWVMDYFSAKIREAIY